MLTVHSKNIVVWVRTKKNISQQLTVAHLKKTNNIKKTACKTLLCAGRLYKKTSTLIILTFTAQVTDLELPGTRQNAIAQFKLPFERLYFLYLSCLRYLFVKRPTALEIHQRS